MSKINNNIILIGHLGADPEMQETVNGNKVTRVSIATSYKYRNNKDEMVQSTEWHRLVAWGAGAEFAHKYLRKGNHVGVLGKINYVSFTADNGSQRNYTEIVVDEFKQFDRNGTAKALPF